MKKTILAIVTRLVLVTIALTQLSGCVVRPLWEEDEGGHHHGEYHHEHHEGHFEGHGEHY